MASKTKKVKTSPQGTPKAQSKEVSTPYKVATSKNQKLRLRDAPDGEVIDKLESGTRIEVLSIERGWAKVKGGYVSAEFIEEIKDERNQDELD